MQARMSTVTTIKSSGRKFFFLENLLKGFVNNSPANFFAGMTLKLLITLSAKIFKIPSSPSKTLLRDYDRLFA